MHGRPTTQVQVLWGGLVNRSESFEIFTLLWTKRVLCKDLICVELEFGPTWSDFLAMLEITEVHGSEPCDSGGCVNQPIMSARRLKWQYKMRLLTSRVMLTFLYCCSSDPRHSLTVICRAFLYAFNWLHLAPLEHMLYTRVASHDYHVRSDQNLIIWRAQVHVTEIGDARCLDIDSLYSHKFSRNWTWSLCHPLDHGKRRTYIVALWLAQKDIHILRRPWHKP